MLFASIFFFVLGFVAIAFSIWLARSSYKTNRWPTVPGKILEQKVIEPTVPISAEATGMEKEVRIIFSYTVNGTAYTASTPWPKKAVRQFNNDQAAEKFLRRLPKDALVHYNPSNHQEAFLFPLSYWWAVAALVAGLAGLVAGLAFLPYTPSKNAVFESFIPAGYEVMQKAEGDLNGDGRDDAALALKHKNETGEIAEDSEAQRRLLIILFAKPDGGYEQSFSNASMILGSGNGGAFGDPFQELRIEDGQLAIIHYGGSSQRWGTEAYIKFQNNNWFVIKTINVTNDLTDGTISEEINDYENAEKIEKVTNAAGKMTEKKSALTVKPWAIFATSTIE